MSLFFHKPNSTILLNQHILQFPFCFTFLSKQKDSASLSDEETVGQVAARLESDPYFDGDETERQLQAALATLPDKQRLVFNMKYFEEMKYEDMSALLGTSVGALKASYHLAVKKIEQFFNEID